MIFSKKIKRAFELLRSRKDEVQTGEKGDLMVERGDRSAMIISALITILPIALLVLLVIAAIPLLILML